LYLPGLYDSVELILTSAPYIRNVQTVPDPVAKSVRVVAEIVAGVQPVEFVLRSEVVDAKSKAPAGKAVALSLRLAPREQKSVDFTISLHEGHLWSPEDPFLYELR